MSKEIECEIEVDNLKKTEERLKELGSILLEKFRMNDIYFDKAKFYRNRRMRLRKKDIIFPEKKTCAIYTEKSPSMKDGVQTADEKEESVDFSGAYKKHIKEGIAYESMLNVTRYRLKNSTIELRENIGVMNYVEIESPTIEELEDIMKTLKIEGKLLKEGALNRSLELKGLAKIQVL